MFLGAKLSGQNNETETKILYYNRKKNLLTRYIDGIQGMERKEKNDHPVHGKTNKTRLASIAID